MPDQVEVYFSPEADCVLVKQEFQTIAIPIGALADIVAKCLGTSRTLKANYPINPDLQETIQLLKHRADARNNIEQKKFLFTGTLDSMDRQEAERRVIAFGGHVCTSAHRAVDYVVVGANPGSRLAIAKDLKLEIINEEQFLRLMCIPVPVKP